MLVGHFLPECRRGWNQQYCSHGKPCRGASLQVLQVSEVGIWVLFWMDTMTLNIIPDVFARLVRNPAKMMGSIVSAQHYEFLILYGK